MRAVVCQKFASLDHLVVEEQPSEPCGPRRLRVAVEAAGVNFVDALFVQGRYQIKPPLPFVAGSELAGTVTEVGAGVDGWAVGDRVMANVGLGGFCDEAVISAIQAVRVPDGIDSRTAATLGQSYCTAWFALHRRARIEPGQHVLVLGAGGGVGLAATDVATAAGATVIAAASTRDKRDLAVSRGATHVIDSSTDDVKARARELSGGGVDIIVDPVGGPTTETALRALAFDGQLLIIGFAAGEIPRLPANQILLRNRRVIGVDWGMWALEHPLENAELLREVLAAIVDGELHPVAPRTYRLADAALALADLEQRRVVGKIALVP